MKSVFVFFGCLVLVFLSQGPVSAQKPVDIGREDYYKAFRTGTSKTWASSRRVEQKIVSARNGISFEEHWSHEYQLPDRVRYVQTRMRDGQVTRSEQINIGDARYCKKDEGPWQRTASSCVGLGDGIGGPSKITTSTYRKQKVILGGKPAVFYREYLTYPNRFPGSSNTDGLSFSETTFWIDDNDRLLRVERRRGLVANPSDASHTVETYFYDSKVKIEEPTVK